MSYQPHTLIPVVDFGPFIDGSNKQLVAKEILDSFKSIGFVYLVNHGLSQEKIDSMFAWSKRMFDQSLDVKMSAPHPESGAHHRGYSALGREKVIQFDADAGHDADRIIRDIKESFEIGREDMEEMPNVWFPNGVLPGFKEACLDFYWACYEIEKVVLRALAIGFNLEEDYFLQYHSKADNQLRLLHYPSVQASIMKDPGSTRIPSHSDFCSLTLLLQDDIGGLEVEDPTSAGTFIAALPIPGSIVVNAGDFLMRWSNDQIKSTVHRVRPPPSSHVSLNGENQALPSRYSIPYFCAADLDAVVDSIPGTWSSDHPKKYGPITARKYIIERLAANY